MSFSYSNLVPIVHTLYVSLVSYRLENCVKIIKMMSVHHETDLLKVPNSSVNTDWTGLAEKVTEDRICICFYS